MGQRWFDPAVGRFISQDPIGFNGGLNLYGYANQKSKARAYGTERVICCPYHADHSPSLWVNTKKLCFHCFACEASGLVVPKGSCACRV